MSDLATKLGIKPGYKVALLDTPPALVVALVHAAPEAEFYDSLSDAPYELVLFWPTLLDGLTETFAQLQRQIVPDGAIWAVIPNQRAARQRGRGSRLLFEQTKPRFSLFVSGKPRFARL